MYDNIKLERKKYTKKYGLNLCYGLPQNSNRVINCPGKFLSCTNIILYPWI